MVYDTYDMLDIAMMIALSGQLPLYLTLSPFAVTLIGSDPVAKL